ncbi:TetR/AcrR family transcriptional regulator [Marinovum sp.]|uniref:TetR/AcrR family transcriptional regulator n=1 Tax=Marinovum sp. TaxID=2024839 RepID=UPI002B265439|nr:TetR/AcrR family transcriptional regulator [Marinovum sp.]
MSSESGSYTKRKRAEGEAETRARIAQAAVDLHGSVGPAFTTISAVAERANVRRATVYRHFPDETALFAACSSRWLSQNPLPDAGQLRHITGGHERLTTVLDLIYSYYRPNAQMLANVIRHAEGSPALKETLTGFAKWLEDIRGVLHAGFGVPKAQATDLQRAAIAHASSFLTWRELCCDQDLSDADARDLMCRLVRATFGQGC